ncbi:MAG: hypothetical protein Q9215_002588 [Flavoplaca cf. flavocitrina]
MREKFRTLRLALYDFFFAANLHSFGQLKASWNGISSFVRHEKSWIYRTPFSFRLLKRYAKSCETFKDLKITMHLLQLDAKDSMAKWSIILGGPLRQYLVAGPPEKEPGEKTGSNGVSPIVPKLGNTSKTPGQLDTTIRVTCADRQKVGQPSPQFNRGIRSSPTCATKEWREHEPRTRRKEQHGRQCADARRMYELAMMSRLDDQCSSVCRSTVEIANQLHPTNPLGNRLWDVRDELLFSFHHINILVHRARYLAYLRGQLKRPHPWIHPTSRKQDHVLEYPADPEIFLRRQIQQDLHFTRSDIKMYCMLIRRFYKRRGVEWRAVGMVAQTQRLFPNPDFIAKEDFYDDPKVNSVLNANLLTHRSLHGLQSIVANFKRLRILPSEYRDDFMKTLEALEDSLVSFDLFIWRRALASQHPRKGGSVKAPLNKFKPETLPDKETMKRESRTSSFDRHGPLRSWLSSPSTRRHHLTENASRDGRLSRSKRAAFHTSTKASGSSSTQNEGITTADRSRSGEGGPSDDSDTARQQMSGPLGYYVPSDNMRESMLASRSSRSAYWQYTLYEGPEGQKVKVHYCKSLETTERIARLFLKESVIGFDIEWKPSATIKDGIRKNVALIQLASEERIALFHIARFSKGDEIASLVAPTFKAIMESSSITKVGVSIKGDCTRLRKYMDIDSRGLCELSYLYKLVKFSLTDVKKINRSLVALAKQVEEHLILPMSKDEDVRGSDWSEDLNYQQISYAASDSYAGFQLYHTLNNKRLAMSPCPPLPTHAELGLPIRLANGQTVAEYEESGVEERPPEEGTASSTMQPPAEELDEASMNLEIEDDKVPSSNGTKPDLPKPKPKPTSSPSLSSHPSIIAANDWITKHRASTSNPSANTYPPSYSNDATYPTLPSPDTTTTPSPSSTPSIPPTTPNKPRATPAFLRAYFLFRHHALSITDIASLLRTPPLQNATVASYILEAARLDGLELEREKVADCLEWLPEAGRGRYRWLGKRGGGGL